MRGCSAILKFDGKKKTGRKKYGIQQPKRNKDDLLLACEKDGETFREEELLRQRP